MKREEHANLMKELNTLTSGAEGQARINEIIASVTKDYTEFHDNYSTANTKIDKLSKDNQRLLEANNKLFLELPQIKNTGNPTPKGDIIKEDEDKPLFDLKELGIE